MLVERAARATRLLEDLPRFALDSTREGHKTAVLVQDTHFNNSNAKQETTLLIDNQGHKTAVPPKDTYLFEYSNLSTEITLLTN